MAKLTPLAKGLVSVIVLAGAVSLAWNFGLKNLFDKGGTTATGESSGNANNGNAANNGSSDSSNTKNSGASNVAIASNNALGSKGGTPLKVSIVSFHGYAPALVANGNSLTTQANSIYDKLGANVEFVIQDDIPTLSTIFESGSAQCAWRTSDFWAQEQPNLRNAGMDAKAVMIVDNTQGGDAIIARDKNIRSVEDLAGKQIAMLQYTPSHGMVIDAVDNSSLSARKKASVKYVFINVEEGTAGVRAALESGSVDAVALWDPDLALAIRNANAHVVYSTKVATNLIYDVIVCDQRVLNTPAGEAAIGKLVAGWMDGVTAARADEDNAVDALMKTEEFFTLLGNQEGKPFVKQLFKNIIWTGLEDNARILGLAGGTNHYERVYTRFDQIYRAAGALANPNSPVIPAQDSFDYRFINQLLSQNKSAAVEAAKPVETFSNAQMQAATQNQTPTVTKPVLVNFSSGSAELSKRSQKTIDEEMVPFIENNGSAYFEISGNTDSTGSRATNVRLSDARAEAVVAYLISQWEFPRARFKVVGNGPDKPLCDENNPGAEDLSLEDCRASNRSTRIGVFSSN